MTKYVQCQLLPFNFPDSKDLRQPIGLPVRDGLSNLFGSRETSRPSRFQILVSITKTPSCDCFRLLLFAAVSLGASSSCMKLSISVNSRYTEANLNTQQGRDSSDVSSKLHQSSGMEFPVPSNSAVLFPPYPLFLPALPAISGAFHTLSSNRFQDFGTVKRHTSSLSFNNPCLNPHAS